MAERNEADPDLGARLAVGAIAGFVATMALTAAMRRRHRRKPGTAPAALAPERPELTLALTFAYGAAVGAAIAAGSARPGRVTGALAGGGLWLASHMGWVPAFAALPQAGIAKRDLSTLGAHLAWGWSAAKTMRQLDGVRVLIGEARS